MYFAPRAINFAYYASVLLDALAHTYIMLKLCWHNRRRPTFEYLKQRLYAKKMPSHADALFLLPVYIVSIKDSRLQYSIL